MIYGFLIQSAMEHYAIATPEHPALSLQGSELSYRDLDRKSNQLAHALLGQGVEVGSRVGIYLHKSLELGIAIYGILKAGCVFVPLDPFMPADRLALIMDDCDIEHIVSSDALSGTFSKLDATRKLHVYGVDEQTPFDQTAWSALLSLSTDATDVVLVDQDLGYIMYTSGSTGVPKGMMHTHLGSITYARWGAMQTNMTANDRVASHAPLHFDLSIFDFFSTALVGGTVVLVPETVVKFPASWTKLIESEQISVVFTVPYTLMTMFTQGAMDKRNLSSLRWILFGGEPYPPQQLRALMLSLENVAFTNVYGPAEAPSCTCYNVPLPVDLSNEPIPIGLVSANSADIVVDADDIDCATGEPGELCIRSTTLTRGYWNRPDLNATVYLYRKTHGPFPQVYFRTGDRVVRHEDGLLRFLGRIGRMVKTRGHRVELDEIEVILTSHEAVSEAAAYTVPDDVGSVVILAAVTLNAFDIDVDLSVDVGTAANVGVDVNVGTAVDSGVDVDMNVGAAINEDADIIASEKESELLQFAKSKLPPYAVPRRIHVLDSMPHTSTGKIDRQLLASGEQTREQQ